jgi:hypothetical protein
MLILSNIRLSVSEHLLGAASLSYKVWGNSYWVGFITLGVGIVKDSLYTFQIWISEQEARLAAEMWLRLQVESLCRDLNAAPPCTANTLGRMKRYNLCYANVALVPLKLHRDDIRTQDVGLRCSTMWHRYPNVLYTWHDVIRGLGDGCLLGCCAV